MSVPTEIALPPTCLAQLQVPIIVDGNSSQQAPSLSSSHQDCQVGSPKKAAASKKRKRECMEDKIHEMHLIVLTKESKKLDMEMENLLLEREKLQLEIKKISKANWGKGSYFTNGVSFDVGLCSLTDHSMTKC